MRDSFAAPHWRCFRAPDTHWRCWRSRCRVDGGGEEQPGVDDVLPRRAALCWCASWRSA